MDKKNKSFQIISKLLATANIHINGDRPWDMQVHDDRVYDALLSGGSLALGESYMQRWWDAKALDQFFYQLLHAHLDRNAKIPFREKLQIITRKLINYQSIKRAFKVGEHHYDLGNDLYESMLDKRMIYTCGYWRHANDLNQAQEDKLKLTCQKLHLKPGMRVLDIGCGWGSFAKYAAENYGVSVVGVTISKEQLSLGKSLCKGLPIELRLQDYRDIDEKFDRVVSLGMFEHVGKKNYDTYMHVVDRCLKDQGLFLLHTIGNAHKTTHGVDPWIHKYIFPNGELPDSLDITRTINNKFIIEDWHNFGSDYDKTLMAWHKNFIANWDHLKDSYNDRFKRMWEYYLLCSAGSFRARSIQLWQIVLSKGIIAEGVLSYR